MLREYKIPFLAAYAIDPSRVAVRSQFVVGSSRFGYWSALSETLPLVSDAREMGDLYPSGSKR
jgi:hypothetical protein